MRRTFLHKIILIASASLLFLISILTIFLSGSKQGYLPEEELLNHLSREQLKEQLQEETEKESEYFPENLLAPFVDVVSWVDVNSSYSNNGAPNLEQIYYDTGCKYFNLGFIRADSSQPTEADGTIRWGWGGYYDLSEKGGDTFQYAGIKKSIQDIRNLGGDVIVSFGGQLGNSPWTDSNNEDKLAEMYIDVINSYDLKRIDLDIEMHNQGYENNQINARAVKKAQDQTGVEVALTIPIMPYGWDEQQINLIRAYLSAGVKLSVINNMTMCYGYNGVASGEDFADASIRALQNANRQLIGIYAEFDVQLTEEEAYKMLGATVDIGYENSQNPIFTADMTKRVAEFAKEKNCRMYSFWSVNRDSMLEPNTGIKYQYTHYASATHYLDK